MLNSEEKKYSNSRDVRKFFFERNKKRKEKKTLQVKWSVP